MDGTDRAVWTTRRRPIDGAWKDSVPWFLSRSCLDTYELLNNGLQRGLYANSFFHFSSIFFFSSGLSAFTGGKRSRQAYGRQAFRMARLLTKFPASRWSGCMAGSSGVLQQPSIMLMAVLGSQRVETAQRTSPKLDGSISSSTTTTKRPWELPARQPRAAMAPGCAWP